MNNQNIFRIIEIISLIGILLCLIHAWVIIIPEQTRLLKQCEEKILCEKGMLKGRICDIYTNPLPITITGG